LVKRWRYRGHTGRLIRRHRALRSLDVQTSSITHPLALTVGFVALVVLSRNFVTSGWAGILKFWCASTGVYVAVQMKSVAAIGTFSYQIPALRLQSPPPTSETLSASLMLVCVSMLFAYILFRRFLPLCYLIWAIGSIQISSLLFFYFLPTAFPYDIGMHVASSLEMALILMAVIPNLLMVAYYPLNFSLLRKIGLTVLMLGMVGICAPHLYACHIVIMHYFSVLYMPVLFTVFGVLPMILMIIAIYGWGMS